MEEGFLVSNHLIKHLDSDSVTQTVSPPEDPGNLLVDPGNLLLRDESLAAREPAEDLHIDERVGASLEGDNVIPGKELEIVGGIFFNLFS